MLRSKDTTNATICAVAASMPLIGDAILKGGSKAVIKAAGDTGADSVIKITLKNDADDALEAAVKGADDITPYAYKYGDDVAEAAIKQTKTKTIDDLLKNLKETTHKKGIARNYESSGGFNQTINDFNSLAPSNVRKISTKYGKGKVGVLNDGTKVIARSGSATGGATIEIQISKKKIIKIRY